MIKQQLEDTFEKLAEQGATQTKKAVKSAVQQISSTISGQKMWEEILGASKSTAQTKESTESQNNGKTHTPLDLEKLSKSYQNNDQQKTEALKHRLFQLVKQGEEKLIYDKKKAEQEKKQKELYQEEEKKRKKMEAAREQSTDIPQGKVRKSIFSHKKAAQRQHAEVKPASGKQ